MNNRPKGRRLGCILERAWEAKTGVSDQDLRERKVREGDPIAAASKTPSPLNRRKSTMWFFKRKKAEPAPTSTNEASTGVIREPSPAATSSNKPGPGGLPDNAAVRCSRCGKKGERLDPGRFFTRTDVIEDLIVTCPSCATSVCGACARANWSFGFSSDADIQRAPQVFAAANRLLASGRKIRYVVDQLYSDMRIELQPQLHCPVCMGMCTGPLHFADRDAG